MCMTHLSFRKYETINHIMICDYSHRASVSLPLQLPCRISSIALKRYWYTPYMEPIKGAGGGLHENFSEIDFLIVSDRGDEYLTAAFCPMEKYCS